MKSVVNAGALLMSLELFSCDNCGQVDGYQIGKEHFDSYENMYKIKKSLFTGGNIILKTRLLIFVVKLILIYYQMKQKG